jgi:hypothetical protein
VTYPVGSLPDAGYLANQFIPFKSEAFTGGGSDLDLTDPANNVAPCASALYITGAGNLVARLAGDTTEQTYPVTVGQVLLGAYVLLKGSSTANCIAWKGSG